MCQCPYSGLSHFYTATTSAQGNVWLCQCPYSGLSHFYRSSLFSKLYTTVSMPLLGLIPFLQIWVSIWIMMNWLCQCPYSGLSHFYTSEEEFIGYCRHCVNALTRAYPISTEQPEIIVTPTPCVNALTRAYPISTSARTWTWARTWTCVSMPLLGLIPFLRYPFQNPLKSMVSGSVFRG